MSGQYKPVAGLQQGKSEFYIEAKYSSDECVGCGAATSE